MNAIGDVLRSSRKGGKLRQRDVAEALGISIQYYCDMEAGRRDFAERYIPLLPENMRPRVAMVFMLEHQQAVDRLREYTR